MNEIQHVETPEINSPVASSAGSAPPAITTLPGPDSPPAFPRHPGETPRAFSAFLAWFQLGHGRSLPAVTAALGENPATVKKWSAKYRWSDRLHAFQSGLLQSQLDAQADLLRRHTADWDHRTREFRELEWAAGQKLLAASLCFLENIGDRDVEKMTLGQASRAIQISSRISRQALHGDQSPDFPAQSQSQVEFVACLKKAYGRPVAPPVAAPPSAAVNPVPADPAVGAGEGKL